MRNMRILMTIVGLLLTCQLEAINPIEVKRARTAVFEWFDEYSLASDFDDRRRAKSRFISLFKDENVKIYNDYFCEANYSFDNTYISLTEYVEKYVNKDACYVFEQKISKIKKMSEVLKPNNVIEYEYSFEKEIGFYAKKDGYSVGRREYPKRIMKYNVVLECSLEDLVVKAVELKYVGEPILPFKVYYIDSLYVETTDEELQRICEDKNTYLEKYQYVPHDDLCGDEKIVKMDTTYVKNSFGLGANYGVGSVSLDTQYDWQIDTKRYSVFGVYVTYYRQLSLKDTKKRLGYDVGLKFKVQNIEMEGSFYDEYADLDPDGAPYLRQIEINQYEEKSKVSSIAVPIALRYDYFIKDNLSFFGRVGAEVSLDMANQSEVSAQTKYKGYYDWLFDVTIDQNGIYDFGSYDMSLGKQKGAYKKGFATAVFVATGCSYFISEKWSLDLSLMYSGVLFNSVKAESDYHLSKKMGDWSSAFKSFDGIKPHVFNVNIQLNYNF